MLNERQLEQAEAAEEAARTDGLANIASKLAGTGSAVCRDCDCPIPEARRKAAPWATRCVDCQTIHDLHNNKK